MIIIRGLRCIRSGRPCVIRVRGGFRKCWSANLTGRSTAGAIPVIRLNRRAAAGETPRRSGAAAWPCANHGGCATLRTAKHQLLLSHAATLPRQVRQQQNQLTRSHQGAKNGETTCSFFRIRWIPEKGTLALACGQRNAFFRRRHPKQETTNCMSSRKDATAQRTA
jgi:hypothetical protein